MIIHYEKMVHDYMNGLTQKLRKFAPSEEFLDLWVHDECPNASILNIAEAAHSYGLEKLIIEVSSESTIKDLDMDRLTKKLEQFCQVNCSQKNGGGVTIGIDFSREASLASLEISDVPMLYRLTFNYKDSNYNFEKTLLKQSSAVLVQAVHEGITLQLNVDRRTHIVLGVSFSGAKTDVSRKLFNELCSYMVHKPINECHDHAVISLEYFLRDKSQKRIPSGIVTPFNAWGGFKQLTILVRSCTQAYRKEADLQDQTNFYTPAISKEWLRKSDFEKRDSLQKKIEEFSNQQKIEATWFSVREIQHQFKVILDTHPDISCFDSTLLLELEAYLRDHLERTLCLHHEEEPDQNKMRWDRPAVKSQVAVSKKVNLEEEKKGEV